MDAIEIDGCHHRALLRQLRFRLDDGCQCHRLVEIETCGDVVHLTAEMLYEEATRAKVPVSLATIYNTLHQFTEVGLLRQVAVDGSKAYFDTNVTAHHHFFVEGEDVVFDIPDAEVTVGKTPTPPEGFEIARVDVVVRLRRKS